MRSVLTRARNPSAATETVRSFTAPSTPLTCLPRAGRAGAHRGGVRGDRARGARGRRGRAGGGAGGDRGARGRSRAAAAGALAHPVSGSNREGNLRAAQDMLQWLMRQHLSTSDGGHDSLQAWVEAIKVICDYRLSLCAGAWGGAARGAAGGRGCGNVRGATAGRATLRAALPAGRPTGPAVCVGRRAGRRRRRVWAIPPGAPLWRNALLPGRCRAVRQGRLPWPCHHGA